MIHARGFGQSFEVACGEFSISKSQQLLIQCHHNEAKLKYVATNASFITRMQRCGTLLNRNQSIQHE
jgi:hypothetical protein